MYLVYLVHELLVSGEVSLENVLEWANESQERLTIKGNEVHIGLE